MGKCVPYCPLNRYHLGTVMCASNGNCQARCNGSGRRRYPSDICRGKDHLGRRFRGFPRPIPSKLLSVVNYPIRMRATRYNGVFNEPSRFIGLFVGYFVQGGMDHFQVTRRHFVFRLILLFPMNIRVRDLHFRRVIATLSC